MSGDYEEDDFVTIDNRQGYLYTSNFYLPAPD